MTACPFNSEVREMGRLNALARARPSIPRLSRSVCMIIAVAAVLAGCGDGSAPGTPDEDASTTLAPDTTTTSRPSDATTTGPDTTPATTTEPDAPTTTIGSDTASTTTSSEQPAARLEVSAETTWRELFDGFATSEQDCISGALAEEQRQQAMETLVLSDNTEQWVGEVFGCLENETAADAFLSMTFTSFETAGLALDGPTEACLQETVAEVEVGSLLAEALSDLESEGAEQLDLLSVTLVGCFPEEALEDAFGGGASPERVFLPPESVLWTFVADTPDDLMTVSPTVGDGVVYAASYEGVVYALDAETGDVRWSFETAGDVGPALAAGSGVVHVSGFETHYALDAATGEVLWSAQRPPSSIYTPGANGDTVYGQQGSTWDDLTMSAVDGISGEQLWTAVIPNSGPMLFPVTASGSRVYVSDDEQIHALDATTGDLAWSYSADGSSPGGPPAAFAASEGSVYLVLHNSAYALDEATGELLWGLEMQDADTRVFAPSVVAEDTWYLLSEESRAGDASSTLRAVDASTGSLVWSSDLPLAVAPVAVVDATVFVSDASGVVHAFDTADGDPVWTSEHQLGGPLLAAHGVLYSHFYGYLYILDPATGEQLWSIDANHVGRNSRTYAVAEGTTFVGYQDSTSSGVRAYQLPVSSP